MGSAAALPTRRPIVRFGVFEIDLSSSELRKQGVRIRLQEQPFQVLAVLVERAGQVVSREELYKIIWPDTVVDFERGLNKAITRVREALGDDADSPRFIETLPQRGYRFLAPLETLPAAAPAWASSSNRRWPALGMVALALAAAWWAGRSGRVVPAVSTVAFEVLPPEGFAFEPAGTRQAFAISPDGKRLAFTTVNAAGVYSAWVRELGAIQPQRVPESDGVHNVFWSPDSLSLFAHVRGSLRRSAGAAGFREVLSALPARMLSGAWLSDREILISGVQQAFVVQATGGVAQPLEGKAYPWPQILPGGKRILYVQLDPHTFRYRAMVAALDATDAAREILVSDSRVEYARSRMRKDLGYLFYLREGALLAQPVDNASLRFLGEPVAVADQVFAFRPTGGASFDVSDEGTIAYQPAPASSRIVWLDRSGRESSAVTPAGLSVKYVRLSPDGKSIAAPIYNVERGVTEIWIYDADGRTARRAVSSVGLADSPIWAPDSEALAYLRAAGRQPQVYMQSLGAKGVEEILVPGEMKFLSDWSPDGRYIAFSDTAFPQIENDQGGDVWLVDLKRDRKISPILDTPFRESAALFSPRGKSMAFIADDSGRPEAYVQTLEPGDPPRLTGKRTQISRGGALFLRWRPDGNELFYLGTDSRVYAVAVEPRLGEPEPLFTVPLAARAVLPNKFGFDVSHDGQRFLVATTEQPAPLTVIRDWESGLIPAATK